MPAVWRHANPLIVNRRRNDRHSTKHVHMVGKHALVTCSDDLKCKRALAIGRLAYGLATDVYHPTVAYRKMVKSKTLINTYVIQKHK